MIVCIAEKPSVAREIATILGATRSCNGYLEGNGYQVTWTFGHLCELKYPEDYTSMWKAWSLSALPMIPPRFGIRLKNDAGIQKQFGIIEKLFKSAELIINCGDAGQEGELIQRWVMQKAGASCPVQRLWVSSLTEEAIREGFASLKDQSEYKRLYEAGLSRAIGDWLLGMNATRLYTLKYGERRQGGQPLSIGRVQTPTLALIVRRQSEIENFKPEPYWILTTVYRNTVFTAEKSKFENEEKGIQILSDITNKEFFITDITSKEGKEAPPALFDLTSLQVECNKKFGYSADQTLQLIQSLYEKKLTTYPRVDTTYLSDDIYPKCGGILNALKTFAPQTAPLRGRKLIKRSKVFNSAKVTDHHAIIPTGVEAQAITAEERNVYNLVTFRFIAVFYPDCRFSTTTVLGEVERIKFKVNGKTILEAGWRSLFTKSKEEEEEEENNEQDRILPTFEKREHGPHTPRLTKKMTQPPKPYTEATLLRAMETAGKTVHDEDLREALKENGIGRPSTRAAIIETLFRRHYIRKERKNLYATTTGIELISVIREDLLKSAELTGQWEKKLRGIERGEYDAHVFLDELKQMVTQIVETVICDPTNRRVPITTENETSLRKKTRKQETTISKTKNKKTFVEGDTCPLCKKGTIIRGKTALGCSEWKNGCEFRSPLKQ